MTAQWDLPESTWFLKIVDEWYFRYEGDTIEYFYDCSIVFKDSRQIVLFYRLESGTGLVKARCSLM